MFNTITYTHTGGSNNSMPFVLPSNGFQTFNTGPIHCPINLPNMVAELLPPLPEVQKPPGVGLVVGTVKAFLKDTLPPSAKIAGTVVSAGITASKLVENIDKALDEGESTEEAYTCQIVKTVVEEVSGKIMKGSIVNGIPPYLAAAVASPPVALTVPIVVPLIPQAYQGAQTAATVLGGTAENICHKGFSLAKKIAKKGG